MELYFKFSVLNKQCPVIGGHNTNKDKHRYKKGLKWNDVFAFPSHLFCRSIPVRHHQQPVHSPGLLKSVLITAPVEDTFAARLWLRDSQTIRLFLRDFLICAGNRPICAGNHSARLWLGDFSELAGLVLADTSQIVSVLNMLSAGDIVL